MVVAAIYITYIGLPDIDDKKSERKQPDVIICDQISACIPFLKENSCISRLLPCRSYTPKVRWLNLIIRDSPVVQTHIFDIFYQFNIYPTLFYQQKIVFYCHFPDQLLTKRQSILKKVYRSIIDPIEEFTTGMADKVLVNSKFTG